MNDDKLRAGIKVARREAQAAGPMHALWDTIHDAEAILEGRPSILPRAEVEAILERCAIDALLRLGKVMLPPSRGEGQ